MDVKPKLFLDYDEVCVDLITPWLEWINFKFKSQIRRNFGLRRELRLSDITEYSWLRHSLGDEVNEFWKGMETYPIYVDPLPGAQKFVAKMMEKYDVTIVSFCVASNVVAKRAHALKHFGIDQFISDGQKARHTREGILVDDNTTNIHDHIFSNCRAGVLFNSGGLRPWATMDAEDYLPPSRAKYLRKATTYEELEIVLEEAFAPMEEADQGVSRSYTMSSMPTSSGFGSSDYTVEWYSYPTFGPSATPESVARSVQGASFTHGYQGAQGAQGFRHEEDWRTASVTPHRRRR